MNEANSFGNTIRIARIKKGWEGVKLIEMINNRFTTSYLSKLENHSSIPSPLIIMILADVLDLDPDELWIIAKKEIINNYAIKIEKKYQMRLKVSKIIKGR